MAGKSWRGSAREARRKTGKRELKTLPGCFVVLKKWSVSLQEKMSEAREKWTVDENGMPQGMGEGDLINFHKMILKGSVAEHNFFKDEEENVLEDFTDDTFLNELIDQFPDTEEEIYSYALELNRPLAETSEEESETA